MQFFEEKVKLHKHKESDVFLGAMHKDNIIDWENGLDRTKLQLSSGKTCTNGAKLPGNVTTL